MKAAACNCIYLLHHSLTLGRETRVVMTLPETSAKISQDLYNNLFLDAGRGGGEEARAVQEDKISSCSFRVSG